MQSNRVFFDARDIDRLVLTQTQAFLLRGIYQCAIILGEELTPEIKAYWMDRLDAYKLALAMSDWYGYELIMRSEVQTLKVQNALLTQKLYDRVATKVMVRGGVRYG